MDYLYRQLETLRGAGFIAPAPDEIYRNLNPALQPRPYQQQAFENFIACFENPRLRAPQTLFHMATGSGKTLIMAGLMLYLYTQGYRNFLFFVNLKNLVEKTKDNFLNPFSSKYLFAPEIRIGGERIRIRQVENFQDSDERAINICFQTTQGLSHALWEVHEGALSLDDFAGRRVVLISDEAHHLNADTKRGGREEEENRKSWEYTVERIFHANRENLLLEFTATCQLSHPLIRREYENKIVFDYPLYRYRLDGFSKEIKTLRTDMPLADRALGALILSQYRLKLFEDHRLAVKPVVLFKAANISAAREFMASFARMLGALAGADVERVLSQAGSEILAQARAYFSSQGITPTQLAQELRQDFSPSHCISANDEGEAESGRAALNSLEDADNPYRAVFEVRKLDEGWDVRNLFDIVRLYETRQSGGRAISQTTVAEAQLIGRGARYCPFSLGEESDRYRRKFDGDLDAPLRVCEELYYHCQNDSRYITELHMALRDIGLDLERGVEQEYRLKETFTACEFYKSGLVFANERIQKEQAAENDAFFTLIRGKTVSVALEARTAAEDTVFEGVTSTPVQKLYLHAYSLSQLAKAHYPAVYRAALRWRAFDFDRLKACWPQLRSLREFFLDARYLGTLRVEIASSLPRLTTAQCYDALGQVFGQLAPQLTARREESAGSRIFRPRYIHEVFGSKRVSYPAIAEGGAGLSQMDPSVAPEIRLDLTQEDYFCYQDNFGTAQEKAFVAHFRSFIPRLRQKYDLVWLMRNERSLALYAFDSGARFEPDYILFLRRPRTDAQGYAYTQVFIEPKGLHLAEHDAWKQAFLLEISAGAQAVPLYADNNTYTLRGMHFYNTAEPQAFDADMEKLLDA